VSDRAIILIAVAFVVGLGALLVWSFDAAKVECRERGGWFTMVGGYPACLPPGGKP
jgi:hypothetical protein